jgi:hypothetical protein
MLAEPSPIMGVNVTVIVGVGAITFTCGLAPIGCRFEPFGLVKIRNDCSPVLNDAVAFVYVTVIVPVVPGKLDM